MRLTPPVTMTRLLVLMSLSTLFLSQSLAATYSISQSEGNDANTDHTPTLAWKTIDKINGENFSTADSILFKRGYTWRERLIIGWSGTASDPIIIRAYDEGPKPRILGSDPAENRSSVAGYTNVWRSGSDLARPFIQHPASIFFLDDDSSTTWGQRQGLLYRSTLRQQFLCPATGIRLVLG
jgi:hypothetical protein